MFLQNTHEVKIENAVGDSLTSIDSKSDAADKVNLIIFCLHSDLIKYSFEEELLI